MWFKRRKRARREVIEQATAAPGELRVLPPTRGRPDPGVTEAKPKKAK